MYYEIQFAGNYTPLVRWLTMMNINIDAYVLDNVTGLHKVVLNRVDTREFTRYLRESGIAYCIAPVSMVNIRAQPGELFRILSPGQQALYMAENGRSVVKTQKSRCYYP